MTRRPTILPPPPDTSPELPYLESSSVGRDVAETAVETVRPPSVRRMHAAVEAMMRAVRR